MMSIFLDLGCLYGVLEILATNYNKNQSITHVCLQVLHELSTSYLCDMNDELFQSQIFSWDTTVAAASSSDNDNDESSNLRN